MQESMSYDDNCFSCGGPLTAEDRCKSGDSCQRCETTFWAEFCTLFDLVEGRDFSCDANGAIDLVEDYVTEAAALWSLARDRAPDTTAAEATVRAILADGVARRRNTT